MVRVGELASTTRELVVFSPTEAMFNSSLPRKPQIRRTSTNVEVETPTGRSLSSLLATNLFGACRPFKTPSQAISPVYRLKKASCFGREIFFGKMDQILPSEVGSRCGSIFCALYQRSEHLSSSGSRNPHRFSAKEGQLGICHYVQPVL